jgi:hypothetical protein
MPYKSINFRSIIVKSYYIFPEISQKEKKEIESIKLPDDDRDESIDTEKQLVKMRLIIIIH